MMPYRKSKVMPSAVNAIFSLISKTAFRRAPRLHQQSANTERAEKLEAHCYPPREHFEKHIALAKYLMHQ